MKGGKSVPISIDVKNTPPIEDLVLTFNNTRQFLGPSAAPLVTAKKVNDPETKSNPNQKSWQIVLTKQQPAVLVEFLCSDKGTD